MTYNLSLFLMVTFSTLNFVWFAFLQFFFEKHSSNFFNVKSINNIYPRNSIFNFFHNEDFFIPIWRVTFCKDIFLSWYSYIVTNFKLTISIIFSSLKLIHVLEFTSTGFILIVLWHVLLHSLTISSNLTMYIFFDIEGELSGLRQFLASETF